jgi:predicted transcriptional regulator
MEESGMKSSSEYSSLTAAEAEIMDVIWSTHPAAVPDIVERIPRTLAYTTVMTTVRILEDKGFVSKCGKRGRAFLYQPNIDREQVRRSMAGELADRLFDGSIKSLVLSLVGQDGVTSEELAEVKQLIEKMESQR